MIKWVSISVAIFLFLGSATYFYSLYQKKKSSQTNIPIQIIAQTGPEKEALKTDYLAEFIGLCCDQEQKPIQIEQARKKLLASPIIKEAEVKQIVPGILSIDYSLRQPYVFLGDYENAALDREGYLFPFFPFYTPKNLPRLYLGKPSLKWGIQLKKSKLTFDLLNELENKIGLIKIKTVDLSQAEHSSLGRREIVVIIEEKGSCQILRLTPHNYINELKNYSLINCEKGDYIIDLRLPNLAFIKGKSDDPLY